MARLLGGPGWRSEAGQILHLAVPLATAQLAQMAMGVTDSVMMGHLSTQALAAGGLVATLTWMMLAILQGLLQGLQPLVAHARGARDTGAFGALLGAALLMAALLSVPLTLYIIHVDRVLTLAGQSDAVTTLARQYALALAAGMPAGMIQSVVRNYLSAFGHTRVIMLTVAAGALFNLLVNWLLIFGHWGLPRLGLAGAGAATAISWWLMLAVFIAYAARIGLVPHDLFAVPVRRLIASVRELLHLGWSIAGIWALESSMFGGSALVAGRFGEVPLAAHQICMNICSVVWMIPFAISTAATIRVGFRMGERDAAAARRSGLTALAITILIQIGSSLVIMVFAQDLLAAYLGAADPNLGAVLALGGQMLRIAAGFQLFDGLQVVAAGALRGLKDTRAAFLAAFVGYWLLGMPAALLMAFPLGLGAVGIWWAFLISLAVVALSLSWRFHIRTFWLVHDAQPA